MPPREQGQHDENFFASLDDASENSASRRSTRSSARPRDEDEEMPIAGSVVNSKRQQREASLPALDKVTLQEMTPAASRNVLQTINNPQMHLPPVDEIIDYDDYTATAGGEGVGAAGQAGGADAAGPVAEQAASVEEGDHSNTAVDAEGFAIDEEVAIEALEEELAEHVSLSINNILSPPWQEAAYPPAGKTPINPPERIIRYSILPSLRQHMEADIRTKVYMTAQEKYAEDNEKYPFFDSERQVVVRPIVTFPLHNGKRVADVSLPTKEMAAAFCQVATMTTGARASNSRGISLSFIKAGLCHSRGLVHIKIRPSMADGANPDRITVDQYIEAIENFLANYPVLELVGAWRHRIAYGDGGHIWDHEASLVVKRQPGLALHTLPGFYPTYNAAKIDGREKVWFHLFFGNRPDYCRRCKTLVHEDRDCPLIRCKVCNHKGHIGGNCTGGNQRGAKKK